MYQDFNNIPSTDTTTAIGLIGPEEISAIAGALLSLIMNYVPGVSTALDRLSSNGQRGVMAVLLAVVAIGTAVWACTAPEAGGIGACMAETSWRGVVMAYVYALVANQGVDRLSPKSRRRNETPKVG